MPSISVIIPVYNAAPQLRKCLERLAKSLHTDYECIVVDDSSTDDSAGIARSFGARVFSTSKRTGPAAARNAGARHASSDILFFLDADVCVYPDTLSRVHAAFAQDPELSALFGSYDAFPEAQNFLSQYKNLMHCYVHQNGRRNASTFWSACGAIRRGIFQDYGGFDAREYKRPAIEDIELGYRLASDGCKVILDPSLVVTHLKEWTFWALLRTEIQDRGIPWTELILQANRMPDDLNLQVSQRVSVALVLVTAILALMIGVRWTSSHLTPVLVLALLAAAGATVVVNRRFYFFLSKQRGRLFALAAIPLHLLYYFYSGVSFAIGAVRHFLRSERPQDFGLAAGTRTERAIAKAAAED